MKLKQVLLIVLISSASAFGSVALYNKLFTQKSTTIGSLTEEGKLPVNYAHFIEGQEAATGDPVDFTKAASAAVPAVVHIKTKVPAKKVDNGLSRQRNTDDLMDWFFGPGTGFGPAIIPEQRASGSGVLISDDGY